MRSIHSYNGGPNSKLNVEVYKCPQINYWCKEQSSRRWADCCIYLVTIICFLVFGCHSQVSYESSSVCSLCIWKYPTTAPAVAPTTGYVDNAVILIALSTAGGTSLCATSATKVLVIMPEKQPTPPPTAASVRMDPMLASTRCDVELRLRLKTTKSTLELQKPVTTNQHKTCPEQWDR